MNRYSNEVWRRPTDPEELAWRRYETDRNFWEFVDSRGLAAHEAHEDSWAAHRGTECLALNSQGDRCGQEPLTHVPFCAFHFDRAWERIEAFVAGERMAHINSILDFERRQFGVDMAMVHDARRVMAAQPERVYFYAVDHAVKIGRSIDPERRVRTLTGTKAPSGLSVHAGDLLGTIPGGCHLESHLHQRFSRHHLVGEWFELAPIRDDIEALLTEAAEDGAA